MSEGYKVCEFCMHSRRPASFALDSWWPALSGPWCKFCEREFRGTQGPADLTEARKRLDGDEDEFREWLHGLVHQHANAAYERHHGQARPPYWWRPESEREHLVTLFADETRTLTAEEEYRELVHRVAGTRPELTPGMRDELLSIIRKSRARQASETPATRSGQPDQGQDDGTRTPEAAV
jgi:hypothetical protein